MHPQPNLDELFSSWLVRLSLANGLPLHSFYSGLLKYRWAIWTRDIDRHPAASFLECLSDATKILPSQLKTLTLMRYEGVFYEDLAPNGVAPWVLPVGIYHRTHKLAGVQFCPLCLKNDVNPYYRLKWRIGIVVLCDVHHCRLEDRCPRCGAPVMFHRHGIGRGKYLHPRCIKNCHACDYNLSAVEPSFPVWPDHRSLFLLERLIRDFELCPWQNFPVDAHCPVPFFTGLRAILTLLNGRYGERLQSVFCAGLSIEPLQASVMNFEYLSTTRRLRLLLCACWLIDEWPERFVHCCRAAGLTRSRILEEPDASPFWLETTLSGFLDSRTYSPNQTEFLQAVAYLASRGLPLSCQSISEILGVKLDAARRLMKMWLPHA